MSKVFQIGEKVKLLHSRETGEILQILPEGKALVLIDDVLEDVMDMDELVAIEPPKANAKNAATPQKTTAPTQPDALKDGLYLAIEFVGAYQMNFYFVNHTDWELSLVVYNRNDAGKAEGKIIGQAAKRQSQLLFCLTTENWETHRRLVFQILFFKTAPDALPAPAVYQCEVKGKLFTKPQRFNPYLNRNSHFLSLDAPEPEVDEKKQAAQVKIELSDHQFYSQQQHTRVQRPEAEIDLHIEALLASFQDLDAAEMLKVQLKKFESAKDAAHSHGMQKITFIHGIGEGKLKSELHRRLRNLKYVRSFHIEPHVPYCGGATTVLLK